MASKSNKQQDTDKISFIKSIAAKIMLLVFVCVAVTVTVCTLIFISNAKNEITNVTLDYIEYVSKAERDLLLSLIHI